VKKFLTDMTERAVKTAAQTAIAAIGTAQFMGEIDWRIVGSTVGLAVILSVLTSLASRNFGEKDTASIADGKGV
jgi:type IV secretory pathway VirB2 component (pilin)